MHRLRNDSRGVWPPLKHRSLPDRLLPAEQQALDPLLVLGLELDLVEIPVVGDQRLVSLFVGPIAHDRLGGFGRLCECRGSPFLSRAEFSVTDGPHLRIKEACLLRYSFTSTPTFYVASSNRIEGQ
jgi:hypothetical protein